MRGEHFVGSSEVVPEGGSSPHTRGTPPTKKGLIAVFRFIPAYAGNAASSALRRSCAAVHPRIRGERITDKRTGLVHDGSSPHTRGTNPAKPCRSGVWRFIPAYAGNAASRCEMPATSSVHPRIRGERNNEIARVAPSIGSSPHTRGTPVRDDARVHIDRFIPAYAGNADQGRQSRSPSSVHPRMRGERRCSRSTRSASSGSSPHARGTQVGICFDIGYHRFIPACAGNAPVSAAARLPATVHPRMRGER